MLPIAGAKPRREASRLYGLSWFFSSHLKPDINNSNGYFLKKRPGQV
jgi:hypothetical protein